MYTLLYFLLDNYKDLIDSGKLRTREEEGGGGSNEVRYGVQEENM